jgi:hypothetical protein
LGLLVWYSIQRKSEPILKELPTFVRTFFALPDIYCFADPKNKRTQTFEK